MKGRTLLNTMLTIKEAKKLLKKQSKKYTDEQLNGVVEWLHNLAIIEVEQIKTVSDEKSSYNVPC